VYKILVGQPEVKRLFEDVAQWRGNDKVKSLKTEKERERESNDVCRFLWLSGRPH